MSEFLHDAADDDDADDDARAMTTAELTRQNPRTV